MEETQLVRRLRQVLPADGVLTGTAATLAYAHDGQTLHGGRPSAIVLPRSTDEIVRAMEVARDLGVPVVPRGAGTGLSGGAVAAEGLLIGTARMNRILSVDPGERTAVVQPGVVNAAVTRAVAVHGLRFAPDPSSQVACTVGGNVAENAGGPHTLRLGVTTNHVLGIELVTSDAHVHRLGACRNGPRSSHGDDALTGLVIGSEGLFGVVTEIVVRLVPEPEAVKTLLASFGSLEDAGRAVAAVMASGVIPAAIELMDGRAVRVVEPHVRAGFPLDAEAVLLVELEGSVEEIAAQESPVIEALRSCGARDARTASDEAERTAMWKGRKQVLGAVGKICRGFYTHDGVVPPSRLAEALRRMTQIAAAHGLDLMSVSHAGDGNLHPLLLFQDLSDDELARGAAAGREILKTCLEMGGSLTGEHGIGGEKRELLDLQYDEPTRSLFQRIRRAFDPDGRMNPGKVFPSGSGCGEVGLAAETKTARGWL